MSNKVPLSDFAKAMRKQVSGQKGGIKGAAKIKVLQSPHLTPFKKTVPAIPGKVLAQAYAYVNQPRGYGPSSFDKE